MLQPSPRLFFRLTLIFADPLVYGIGINLQRRPGQPNLFLTRHDGQTLKNTIKPELYPEINELVWHYLIDCWNCYVSKWQLSWQLSDNYASHLYCSGRFNLALNRCGDRGVPHTERIWFEWKS